MRIEIRAVVEVPDGTPMDAVEEWVKYELGAGSMPQSNPLSGESMSCSSIDVEKA
jgi:hypothetical protein